MLLPLYRDIGWLRHVFPNPLGAQNERLPQCSVPRNNEGAANEARKRKGSVAAWPGKSLR